MWMKFSELEQTNVQRKHGSNKNKLPPWGRSIPHSNIPNTGFDWSCFWKSATRCNGVFELYLSLTYLVDRTIFDECAFSNHFQRRDSHVATWMHMTSRLNTTRGSQLVAKQWRRCALGDLGPGGHTTILARGHTSHFPWGSRSTNKPFGAVRDSCGPATSFITYTYTYIYTIRLDLSMTTSSATKHVWKASSQR